MKTVLLVEDDAWLSDLYRDVLTSGGYRVMQAHDASEAAEHLQQAVDVIVLDLLLPVHSGISLLHELRSYTGLADIPVIIQSAVDPREHEVGKEVWEAYGVVAYIAKSQSRPQDLLRTVRRVIGE